MNIIFLILPITLALGILFLVAFTRSAQRGQFDDLETPAHRILLPETQSHDPVERETTL